MTEVYLGIIAVAVALMAIVQVAAIVFAARAARSVGEAVTRFEQAVTPIVTNLQAISADTARVAAAATAQVERAQQTIDVVLTRVDSAAVRFDAILKTIEGRLLAPAREGFAVLQAIRAMFSSRAKGPRSAAPRPRPRAVTPDDEEALFIG